jgi:hypothetical protein
MEVHMKIKLSTIPALLLALLLLSGLANAQSGTTGAIEGRVLDEQGNPLPGAAIKLSSPDLIGGPRQTPADGGSVCRAAPRDLYAGPLAGFSTEKR